MPIAEPTFGWVEAVGAFAVLSAVAFLVTWVVTDLARVRRTPYIAVLGVATAALCVGYLAWSGTAIGGLVTEGWGWGIVGAAAASAVVAPLVRRLPAGPRPGGVALRERLLWEGVVYGIAEAVLLSTLPVLVIWQAVEALGWTESVLGGFASGALALIGALFVIAVHHLGYREFRRSRKMLAGALVACGVQALAFLVTANVLAPIVAHIVLHGQLTLRGNEMPPSTASQASRTSSGSARPTVMREEEVFGHATALRRHGWTRREGSDRRVGGQERGPHPAVRETGRRG